MANDSNRIQKGFVCIIIICSLLGVVYSVFKRQECIDNNMDNIYIEIKSVTVPFVKKNSDEIADKTTSGKSDDELAAIIRKSFKKKITFDINVYPKLSRQALEIAYDRNLTLEGRGKDYSLIIKGEEIQDYNNELDMKINIKALKGDYILSRESKEELPGKVVLKIRNKKYFKNNLYLYNKVKGKYEYLQKNDMEWDLDKEGKYLLTNKDLYQFKLNYKVIIYVSIGIFVMIVIYILIKKKYWFW